MSIIFERGWRITPNTLAPSVLLSNLVLYYDSFNTSSYNGSGTTIYDISGNNRNGTITGSPTWDTNYFTFTDDYITTPELSSIIPVSNEVHSVELWVYPTNNGVLVQYNSTTTPNAGYHFSAIELVGGNLEVGLWNGTSISSTGNISTVSFNEWHQIVLTYDGTTCKGYLDGVYKGSVNVSFTSPMDYSSPFYMNFGYRDITSQGDGTDFDGRFGIMRVYNVALTDAQILSNYNSTLTTIPNIITDGLVLRLDATNTNSYNGSGTTWFDIRGDYDFTLTNSPTFNSEGYFDFNGTNQYAITAHNSALKPTSELTIEQWLWADDWTSGDSVNYKTSLSCTQGGGYAHYIWSGTWRSYVRVGASYQIPTFDVSGLTGWHHFVTTFDGRYTKLYVDGVLVDTEDLGTSGNVIGYDADNSIVIGTEAAGTPGGIEAKYWDGKISTTLLYSRALTQMEVLQNFNANKLKFGL